MLIQERQILVLKRLLAVVFLLAGDVIAHRRYVGLRNGERAITGLPGERLEMRTLGFDPFRGRFLGFLDDLTQGDRAAELEEDMDVVLDGIDEDGGTAEIGEHLGHVAVQGVADRVGDQGFAAFGAEDQMNVEAREGLRHGAPFQGSERMATIVTQGDALRTQGGALGYG